MLTNRTSLKEEAYIGEELLNETSDLERKCLVVRQCVRDGDFSLEEALSLYEVSKEDYEKFLALNAVQEIQVSLSGASGTLKVALTIEVMAKMVRTLFGKEDAKSTYVIHQLETLSNDIKEQKVSV